MFFDFLKFFFQLLIAGFILRYAETRLVDKNSQLANALTFIY